MLNHIGAQVLQAPQKKGGHKHSVMVPDNNATIATVADGVIELAWSVMVLCCLFIMLSCWLACFGNRPVYSPQDPFQVPVESNPCVLWCISRLTICIVAQFCCQVHVRSVQFAKGSNMHIWPEMPNAVEARGICCVTSSVRIAAACAMPKC